MTVGPRLILGEAKTERGTDVERKEAKMFATESHSNHGVRYGLELPESSERLSSAIFFVDGAIAAHGAADLHRGPVSFRDL
mmetsp:Transcript_11100/g.30665  ORF Transcript_11100/g.30665 Transcript_11100/m.30665 type:complete len:81 (+) Transcript_11100:553-795(+)